MLTPLFSFRARKGANAQLSVLTFHRAPPVFDAIMPGEPDASRFDRWVKRWSGWFNFLPLTEAVVHLRDGTLPARAACLTFDDGYADNREIAAPILKKLGIPATFFVATDFLDGGMMFNDRVVEALRGAKGAALDLTSLGFGVWPTTTPHSRARSIDGVLKQVKYLPYAEREVATMAVARIAEVELHPHPMMTVAQVRELADMGFEIGAHTMSHPILRALPDDQARAEIVGSRARLQEITGQKIKMFAYPNGKPNEDYDLRHVAMVREAGFLGAVATIAGAGRRGDDLFQIPRFTPWHGDSWKSAVQFLRNYSVPNQALKP